MTNIAEQTLASIVTANYQTAPVFEKYNLDFCCKGKRTLAQACTEKGIAVEKIVQELDASAVAGSCSIKRFSDMDAQDLISHILIKHHFYTKQIMPVIEQHLTKVAQKHGDNFPYMKEVLQLFMHLKSEMLLHLQKEEVVLFPRIKMLEATVNNKQEKGFNASSVAAPLQVMENEHDEAGEIMHRINILTNNYTAPDGACTTFKLVLSELKGFEEDLHQHVHLENNLLFPKATALLEELSF